VRDGKGLFAALVRGRPRLQARGLEARHRLRAARFHVPPALQHRPTPARYLATAYGSLRYPFTEAKKKALFGGVSTSLKKGGDQIEYEDQEKSSTKCTSRSAKEWVK
jgi:hypothetical protein